MAHSLENQLAQSQDTMVLPLPNTWPVLIQESRVLLFSIRKKQPVRRDGSVMYFKPILQGSAFSTPSFRSVLAIFYQL